MKKTVLTGICILALLMAGATTASADLVSGELANGGFEYGLRSWDTTVPDGSNAGYYRPSYTSGDGSTTWEAVEGNIFAYIFAGAAGSDYGGNDTTLSQTFSLSAGDLLSGYVAYDYGDDYDYVAGYGWDGAYLKIVNYDDPTDYYIIWDWEGGVDGFYETDDLEWTAWSYDVLEDGMYTLVLGAYNAPDGDAAYAGVAMLDGVTVTIGGASTDPVPEPATMLLLGSGLMGLAGASRRKFKK